MTEVDDAEIRDTRSARAARIARRVAWSLILFSIVVGVPIYLMKLTRQKRELYLFGIESIGSLEIATAAFFIGVAVLLWLRSRRWWIRIPAQLIGGFGALILLFMLAFVPTHALVPLMASPGCATGYIIDDAGDPGLRSVFKVDGILMERVKLVDVDWGYRPISEGAYSIETDGNQLTVTIALEKTTPPMQGATESFVLPALTTDCT